jgi:hypothetical protein
LHRTVAVSERVLHDCCESGDILVMEVYSGFVIGRIIPKIGPGPWWNFVTVVGDRDAAVDQARAMARAEGFRAWFQHHPNEYEPL